MLWVLISHRSAYNSDKVAEISYASKLLQFPVSIKLRWPLAIQGKDCLIQKFRNSSVMEEWHGYRPKVSPNIQQTASKLTFVIAFLHQWP